MGSATHRFAGLLLVAGVFGSSVLGPLCCTGSSSARGDADLGPIDGRSDSREICKDPRRDYDHDGISNGLEGCLSGRDSDGDGTADWQDFDSDGDKILDSVEKTHSSCRHESDGVCDSDGDGRPDYLDTDSDNDEVPDEYEDVDGDGFVGCCLKTCGKYESRQKKRCELTEVGDRVGKKTLGRGEEGCAPGQICKAGACTPPVHFSCSMGETDRTKKDTFGDGTPDGNRGTFICHEPTAAHPVARERPSTRASVPDRGDWHVAIDKRAAYGELALPSRRSREAAAVIEMRQRPDQVAGLLVSRASSKPSLEEELEATLSSLAARLAAGATLTLRRSASIGRTQDRFGVGRGSVYDISLARSGRLSQVRTAIVASLLGRSLAQLGKLPPAFGPSGKRFELHLTIIRRYPFERRRGRIVLDSSGNPVEDDSATSDLDRRVIALGAVVPSGAYADSTTRTREIVDDLTNATGVAKHLSAAYPDCLPIVTTAGARVKLPRIPISGSLALALEGSVVPRSSTKGFQYDADRNAIVFVGMTPGAGDHLLVSQYLWQNGCFVAGTAIATPSGPVPTEDLQVGDAVLAFDHQRGAVVASAVTRTFVHRDRPYGLVETDAGTLGVTPEHPIYAVDRRSYLPARSLDPSMTLLRLGGRPGARRLASGSVRGRLVARHRGTVFNISVARYENYFAGGLLVHNKPPR